MAGPANPGADRDGGADPPMAVRENGGMATSRVSDFGQCGCSGDIQLHWVEVRFGGDPDNPANGRMVPQGRCPTCGSRYYTAFTLQALEETYTHVNVGAEVPKAAL